MTDTEPLSGSGPVVDADTYGLLLLELFEGREAHEIMERSDGLIYVGDGADYFHERDQWPLAEQRAISLAHGRVLDIGCGAGRIALDLQSAGCDVVAIDESASAVEVTRRRGVRDARTLRWQDVSVALGRFDTIVLARNNFGLLGDLSAIPSALRSLAEITTDAGLLISDSVAPSRGGDDSDRFGYRVRYGNRATEWFRYLMFEPEDLPGLTADTGWEPAEVFDTGEPRWNFVLRRI
jgi:SAM-dependent methyltransferase